MLDLKERVALGAAWLDSFCPKWPTKINIFNLDMQDMDNCILGQLHGNLGSGMAKYVLESGEEDFDWFFWENHGIILPFEEDIAPHKLRNLYKALTEQWRGAIEERQK